MTESRLPGPEGRQEKQDCKKCGENCAHTLRSILAVLRIAREGNYIADVLHTGHKEYQALESETKSE